MLSMTWNLCCKLAAIVMAWPLRAVVIAQPTSGPLDLPFHGWAVTPPMGWNSWDCFGAGVTEQQALDNAEYIDKHLKSHGWNIVTIDIQWYEPQAHTDQYRRGAVLEMDENGRLLPAANLPALTVTIKAAFATPTNARMATRSAGMRR